MDAAPLLRDLQREFMAALYDPGAPGPLAAIDGNGLTAAGRLSLYRSGCSESQTAALRVTYPAVRALVGDAFFDQTAHGYRRSHPSRSGNLQAFGARLGDYLGTLDACGAYPYLPDVARLEWSRQQAVLAADAVPIDGDSLRARIRATAAPVRLSLHPSLRLVTSLYPVLRIWRFALHPSRGGLTLGDGESVVIWREDGEVAMGSVDRATFVCVVALQRGESIDAARAAAVAVDRRFNLCQCVGTLIEHGLIVGCKIDAPAGGRVGK